MANLTGKQSLPLLPHADHLRKQAKSRLANLKTEQPEARLADVQRTLAREYGFAHWAALQAEVTRRVNGGLGRRLGGRRALADFYRAAEHPDGEAAPPRPTDLVWPGPLSSRRFAYSIQDSPPLILLRAGIVAQVSGLVAILLGIGVVCFALHRAGVPFTSHPGSGPSGMELLHKVI